MVLELHYNIYESGDFGMRFIFVTLVLSLIHSVAHARGEMQCKANSPEEAQYLFDLQTPELDALAEQCVNHAAEAWAVCKGAQNYSNNASSMSMAESGSHLTGRADAAVGVSNAHQAAAFCDIAVQKCANSCMQHREAFNNYQLPTGTPLASVCRLTTDFKSKAGDVCLVKDGVVGALSEIRNRQVASAAAAKDFAQDAVQKHGKKGKYKCKDLFRGAGAATIADAMASGACE